MDFSTSDEDLEITYKEITRAMNEVRSNVASFENILEATGLEIWNFEEFDNMDDATMMTTYNEDSYLIMKIGSTCRRRLRDLNKTLYKMTNLLPRYLSYDSTTKKHTWDRDQLYEDLVP